MTAPAPPEGPAKKAIKIILTAVVYSTLEDVEREIARFKEALGTRKLRADVRIMEPLIDEAVKELLD